jgi:ArsR family transcriptional regulator
MSPTPRDVSRVRSLLPPLLDEHMRVLVGAGLVDAKRIKQWTFYKRNERAIAAFTRALRDTL